MFMHPIQSARRNASIEDNLKAFNDMLKGEVYAQKYCLRAKIDMTSVNGTMRDPVLYRYGIYSIYRCYIEYVY